MKQRRFSRLSLSYFFSYLLVLVFVMSTFFLFTYRSFQNLHRQNMLAQYEAELSLFGSTNE